MRLRTVAIALGAALIISQFSPAGADALNTNSSDLPVTFLGQVLSNANPTSDPANLVQLAALEKVSVVAVTCNETQGSGWSAEFEPTAKMVSAGIHSYIITSYQNIKNCISDRQVTLTDSSLKAAKGTIWAWDAGNDLAAIATTSTIPELIWTGTSPAFGSWVGLLQVLGNGQPFLTTGILSSVNQSENTSTTISNIYPERSGGPVFDRLGQVIGTGSAIAAGDTANVTIRNSTILCISLVRCNKNIDPMPEQLVTAAQIVVNDSAKILQQLVISVNSAMKKQPKKVATLKKFASTLPKIPNLKISKDPIAAATSFAYSVNNRWKVFSTNFKI